MNNIQSELFKKGSKTYFTSSLFFPPNFRKDVTRLYAFVRKPDDFVDSIPQQTENFMNFKQRYEIAFKRRKAKKEDWQSGDIVIDDFILLAEEKHFDPAWASAFLDAMEADTKKKTYRTIAEVEEYMYGSAEVVGLFMCNMIGLSSSAHHAARSLGKAMQYINFIRDIQEDISLGRQYLPKEEMLRFGLVELSEKTAMAHPKIFSEFVRAQIQYFSSWQKTAEEGYALIPKRYRIAIKTAADMYKWTAQQIERNPMIVFHKKIKPSSWRIAFRAVYNALFS